MTRPDPPAGAPGTVWITRLDPDDDPNARADGLRVAVKDCIDLAGTVTTSGSPVLAETGREAEVDAECLAGFRRAGARFVGKANLHELAFGGSGVNPHYGTPTNPVDPRRIPGGSSSGSAVAVATGQADVGIGTDTAGSIRNPAAACGVVGLKTTYGTVPLAGVRPLAPSLDTVGVLAPSVELAAAGATLLDERLTSGELVVARRVGRLRLPDTDPTVDAAIDSALLAAGLVARDVAVEGWSAATAAATTVLFGEALIVNDDLWRHHHDRLGAEVVERFTFAQSITPDELAEARGLRPGWRAELGGLLEELGPLVLPTMVGFPPRVGDQAVAPNPACPAVNLAGYPAISVPVPTGGLLPAGLQMVGGDGAEATLLATAAAIEASLAA